MRIFLTCVSFLHDFFRVMISSSSSAHYLGVSWFIFSKIKENEIVCTNKVFFVHTSVYRHPEWLYVLHINLSFLISLTIITYAMLMNT